MEIAKVNANSVDPDQTPQNAASDLCLHWLPMYFTWDARHKLVNYLTMNIKALTAMVGRLSLSVGLENGSERGVTI